MHVFKHIIVGFIRLLGGISTEEFSEILDDNIKLETQVSTLIEEKNELTDQQRRIDQQVENWRQRAKFFQEKYDQLDKQYDSLRERNDQLIELLIKGKTSVTSNDPPILPTVSPISTLPMSWPRAQRVFEQKDREKLRKDKSDA